MQTFVKQHMQDKVMVGFSTAPTFNGFSLKSFLKRKPQSGNLDDPTIIKNRDRSPSAPKKANKKGGVVSPRHF